MKNLFLSIFAFLAIVGLSLFTGVSEVEAQENRVHVESPSIGINMKDNSVGIVYTLPSDGEWTIHVDINVRWEDGTTTNTHENRQPVDGRSFPLEVHNGGLCPVWVQVHGTNNHPTQSCESPAPTPVPGTTPTISEPNSPAAVPVPTPRDQQPSASGTQASQDVDVYGCPDPEAENFSPMVNVNDGSCEYPAPVIPYGDCFNEDLLAITDTPLLIQQRGIVFETVNGRPDWSTIQPVIIENASLLQANTGTDGCHAVTSVLYEGQSLPDFATINRVGDLVYAVVETPEIAETSVTCSQETQLCAYLDAADNGRLYVTDASHSFDWQYDIFADRVEAYGEVLFVTIDGYTHVYSFRGELLSEVPAYGITVASSEDGRYFVGSPLQFEENGEQFVTMGLGQTATDITVWDNMTGVVLVEGNLGYSTNIQHESDFELFFNHELVDLFDPTYFK